MSGRGKRERENRGSRDRAEQTVAVNARIEDMDCRSAGYTRSYQQLMRSLVSLFVSLAGADEKMHDLQSSPWSTGISRLPPPRMPSSASANVFLCMSLTGVSSLECDH